MGFGHRVYKNFDPRAVIIRKTCMNLLEKLGTDNKYQELFDTAVELETIALSDEYFVSRNLYPNVDFLFWYNFVSNGYTIKYVHRYLRYGQNRWLDFSLE